MSIPFSLHAPLRAASHPSPQVQAKRPGSLADRGYTLLEIVVVLILVGIMAAVIAPRFIGTSGFTVQTTADRLLMAARYANTLAQNQGVTTTLTVGATTFQVTQNGAPVTNPSLQSASFVIPIPASVTITPQASVSFSRDESTASVTTPVTFTVAGAGPSVLVYVTGAAYAYECQSGGVCP